MTMTEREESEATEESPSLNYTQNQQPRIRVLSKSDTRENAGSSYLTVPSKIIHRHKTLINEPNDRREGGVVDTKMGHVILPTFGTSVKRIRGFPTLALRTLGSSSPPQEGHGVGRPWRSKSIGAPPMDHQDLKQVEMLSTNIPCVHLPPDDDTQDAASDAVTIPSSYMLPSVILSDMRGPASDEGSQGMPSFSRQGSLNLPNSGRDSISEERPSGSQRKDGLAMRADRRGSSVSAVGEIYPDDLVETSQDRRFTGNVIEGRRDLLLPSLDQEGADNSGSSLLIYHCKGTPGDRRYSLPILVDADGEDTECTMEASVDQHTLGVPREEPLVGFVDPIGSARDLIPKSVPSDSNEEDPKNTIAMITDTMFRLDKLRQETKSILLGFDVEPLTLVSLQRLNVLGKQGHMIQKRSKPIPMPVSGELGELGLFCFLTEEKLQFVEDWLATVEKCRAEGDMAGEIVTEEELSWTYT